MSASNRASRRGDPAITAAIAANGGLSHNGGGDGGSGNSSVSMDALVRQSPTGGVADYGGSSPTNRSSAVPYAQQQSTAQHYGGSARGSHTNRALYSPHNLASGVAFDDDDSTAQRFSATSSAKTLERMHGSNYNSGRNVNPQTSNFYHPNSYMANAAGQGHPNGAFDGQLAAAVPLREDDPRLGGGGGGQNNNAGMLPSSAQAKGDSLPSCAILTFQLLLLAGASVIFTFGVTGTADRLTGAEGWDEVLTVIGMLFIFPILLFLYRLVSPLIPRLQQRTENAVWYWVLRTVLVGSFILQSTLFMLYLVRYNDNWHYFFLVPDVIIVLMMIVSTRLTTLWSFLYVIVTATKMGLFWFNLEKKTFVEKGNILGINGFLAMLMLILPMVHYPVIISRLEAGMTMTEAYTTNMAAVFAHILHVMDSLELYMQGEDRLTLSGTVQYLLLLLALMGFVACSVYYITLFFRDEESENIIRRFQTNALGDLESTRDESMLHYFLWSMIFIDLPYGSLRFVAFLVHNENTILSPFFAKNIAMIGSVLMLLFYNNHQSRRTANAKGAVK